MTRRRPTYLVVYRFLATCCVFTCLSEAHGDDQQVASGMVPASATLALKHNPWSEAAGDLPPPSVFDHHLNALRQLVELAIDGGPVEYFWVDVIPRHFGKGEGIAYAERQRVSEGRIRMVYDLSRGISVNREFAYEWLRKDVRVMGPDESIRIGKKKLALMHHPLFYATRASKDEEPTVRHAVLGVFPGQQAFHSRMQYAMSMPESWRPIVAEFFAHRDEVSSASVANLLAALQGAQRKPSGEDVLTQVFMLRRLSDLKLSVAEKQNLAQLTPPEGDFVIGSLWLSQWMIASYEHDNPVEFGERLDASADANLVKDGTVSRSLFMALIASMGSYSDAVGEIGAPQVPFTPWKDPNEVAGAFFVARVNHIRHAVSKLPKDNLSDWGKSIANYRFMPPYAPWPPATAKEQSPKE